MNGILASALIGVVAVIVGLVIIRLTPEERPKRQHLPFTTSLLDALRRNSFLCRLFAAGQP